ncbi:MAG: hypothetical protein JW818_18090 [Pirellulales bacterium]|nr:hypothetical protein [Pirellulales bacterium]
MRTTIHLSRTFKRCIRWQVVLTVALIGGLMLVDAFGTQEAQAARPRARVVVAAPVAPPVVVAPVPRTARQAYRMQRRLGYPAAVVAMPVPYALAVPVAPPLPVTTWRSPTGFVYRYDYQSAVMPSWPGPATAGEAGPEVQPQPSWPMPAPEAVPTPAPQPEAIPAPQGQQ